MNIFIQLTRCTFVLAACTALFVEAEIRCIDDISVLEEVVTDDTLVLTDVDATLLRSAVSLGWTDWWQHVGECLQKAGIDRISSRPITNPMAGWIMQHIPIEPMEPETAAVVENIQRRGIPILGLTARHKRAPYCSHFDRVTRDHLHSINIDFSKGRIPPEIFSNEEYFVNWGYHDGIIYSNGGKKGPSLVAFLRHNNYHPRRIVLIDDNLDMLESVEAAMEREGIPFLGLHYVKADRPFSVAAANIQWHCLIANGTVPSDEEALDISRQRLDRSANFFLDYTIDYIKTVMGDML